MLRSDLQPFFPNYWVSKWKIGTLSVTMLFTLIYFRTLYYFTYFKQELQCLWNYQRLKPLSGIIVQKPTMNICYFWQPWNIKDWSQKKLDWQNHILSLVSSQNLHLTHTLGTWLLYFLEKFAVKSFLHVAFKIAW